MKRFAVFYVRINGPHEGKKHTLSVWGESEAAVAIDFLNIHASRAEVLRVEEVTYPKW
jgi:hypothetical protein